MYIQKKIPTLVILFTLIFFTGCIKKLDSDGLTLQIQESELNNFSQKFPINQDFVFAFVQLEKPHIYIKNGSNRLTATINTNFSTVFMPNSVGTFSLTGSPYFDKEKSAIFLKDIQIEELKITNIDLDKNFLNTLTSNTKPIIDDIFNTIPIYEVDKSSFKGSLMKDIKIEDSQLLVTFGL